jgi:2-(acetamidomethylene)succinate hydrolase
MFTEGDFRVHRIDVGRLTLNVREVGAGPLMIFLHGITSNSAIWDPIALALKGSFRCIAVDQRGHGLSDKPATGYRANDYAGDVAALIGKLNVGAAIVVGNSLGARNAVATAVLRPDLVTSVVAIDFTPFIEVEIMDALETRVKAGDRSFASQAEIETYLRDRYPLMPPYAVTRRATSAYETVDGRLRPRAMPKAMADTVDGLREELETAFQKVTRPVLVVRGAESKFVTAAALEKTRKLRPDLPVLVVPKVDHYVNEEAPEIMTQAILDFAAKGG